MEAYVDGDADSFDELYRRLAPNLFGYLLRLTRQRDRAEDLLQVTFAKVHRARGSYLRGAPVLPWMLAIARRSFLDERRHASTRTEDLSFDGNLPEPKAEDAAVPADLSAAAIPRWVTKASLKLVSGMSFPCSRASKKAWN